MLTCDRTGCENKAAFAFWMRWGVALECMGHAQDTIRHAPSLKREAIPKAAHASQVQEL